jgi:hypothetical protein
MTNLIIRGKMDQMKQSGSKSKQTLVYVVMWTLVKLERSNLNFFP